jgi:hypothetical protein
MNSANGKLSQTIHDNKLMILDDNAEIDKLYQKGVVFTDVTMENNEQCLLDIHKKRPEPVKGPVHINSFVLAFRKVLMNECINTFDGFTDWSKTFYYTDTDSFIIHHNQVKELEEKRPELIGKKMGQFHDDTDEVEDGNIIEAVFLSFCFSFLSVFLLFISFSSCSSSFSSVSFFSFLSLLLLLLASFHFFLFFISDQNCTS